MNNKSLSNSILDKIKKEHIEPRPQWHFMIKNVLFWSLFFVSSIAGARALGVVFFVFSDASLELVRGSGAPLLPPLLAIIPVFWLAIFVLVILIAVLGLHHTKNGYKLSLTKIIVLNLAGSLILGLALFALGDGERFEKQLGNHIPFAAPEMRRMNVWQQPMQGRLAGQIISKSDATHIELVDLRGENWSVDTSDARIFNTDTNTQDSLKIDMRVRMIGTQTGEKTFKALRIDPWEALPPPRRGMMRNGLRMGNTPLW